MRGGMQSTEAQGEGRRATVGGWQVAEEGGRYQGWAKARAAARGTRHRGRARALAGAEGDRGEGRGQAQSEAG